MEFKRTQFPQLRFRTLKELGAGKLLQRNSLTCNSTGFTSLNTIYFFVILMKSSFKRWLGNQFFCCYIRVCGMAPVNMCIREAVSNSSPNVMYNYV